MIAGVVVDKLWKGNKVRAESLPWFVRRAAFVGLIVVAGLVNVALLVGTIPFYKDTLGVVMPLPMDWAIWTGIWEAYGNGTLYTFSEIPFVWSPLMAPVMALVPVMGFWTWAALHALAVLLLRDWRLIGLVLVSAPFWSDVAGANTFVFVFVAGVLALRGSRFAGIVYLALWLLLPRPVQVPLALWLLWKMPELRWPFVALVVVNALAVLATGYGPEWIGTMLDYGQEPMWNIGPTFLFGTAWLIVGVPLAAWLTWRGHVGLAGLAMSPYVITNYLLMLLIRIPLGRPRPTYPWAPQWESRSGGRVRPSVDRRRYRAGIPPR
jgi:hypothetical protein